MRAIRRFTVPRLSSPVRAIWSRNACSLKGPNSTTRHAAEQLPQGTQGALDVPGFAGRLTVLAVLLLRVGPVCCGHLFDGDFVFVGQRHGPVPCPHFRQHPLVRLANPARGLGAFLPPAKVVIGSAERDHALAANVATEFRRTVDQFRHKTPPFFRFPESPLNGVVPCIIPDKSVDCKRRNILPHNGLCSILLPHCNHA